MKGEVPRSRSWIRGGNSPRGTHLRRGCESLAVFSGWKHVSVSQVSCGVLLWLFRWVCLGVRMCALGR